MLGNATERPESVAIAEKCVRRQIAASLSHSDATVVSVVTTGRETVGQTGSPPTSHVSAIDWRDRTDTGSET